MVLNRLLVVGGFATAGETLVGEVTGILLIESLSIVALDLSFGEDDADGLDFDVDDNLGFSLDVSKATLTEPVLSSSGFTTDKYLVLLLPNLWPLSLW